MLKSIKSALISVFDKSDLEPIVEALHLEGVTIYSTGGTRQFIEDQGIPVESVEELTGYPSILGGRVKTLHPKVFGGILSRREVPQDGAELATYDIPEIDLVMVDLYPFEKTLEETDDHQSIIEKIDIGGIALIRATAKNYKHTTVVSSKADYGFLADILKNNGAKTDLDQRRVLARNAFQVSSGYDRLIGNYLAGDEQGSNGQSRSLRYGENPHQAAEFHGDLDGYFDQLHGKELSFNNLVDIDSAVNLIAEFANDDPSFVIIKHTNACGVATRPTLKAAYDTALACDNVSAFGGILIANRPIDLATAQSIDPLFMEVLIAPDFEPAALELLSKKKNRRLLKQKRFDIPKRNKKSLLNGTIEQDNDLSTESIEQMTAVTKSKASPSELEDLAFSVKVIKHLKSNAVTLVKNKQLLGMGCGQTARVDALEQAITKAAKFGFDLNGAVMTSEAFFPFPDCVEIADKAGIKAVLQPGGSIKDQASIDYCDQHGMSMVFTGVRHFKH